MQDEHRNARTCWYCSVNAPDPPSAVEVLLTKPGEKDRTIRVPRCKTCAGKHNEGNGMAMGCVAGAVLGLIVWWQLGFFAGLVVVALGLGGGYYYDSVLVKQRAQGERSDVSTKKEELVTAYPAIRDLLAAGWVAPDVMDEQGAALFTAIREADAAGVAEILDANSGLLNGYEAKGSQLTAIQFAVSGEAYMYPHRTGKDPAAMAKLLIERGADTSVLGKGMGWQGRALLHYAAKDACLEVVRYLVGLQVGPTGARFGVNARDESGTTPLHLAVDPQPFFAFELKPAVVEFLVAQGADVNAMDNQGNTPLLSAIPMSGVMNAPWEGVVYPVTRVLLALGADPTIKNREGNTALGVLLDHEKDDEPGYRAVRDLFTGGPFAGVCEVCGRLVGAKEPFLERREHGRIDREDSVLHYDVGRGVYHEACAREAGVA